MSVEVAACSRNIRRHIESEDYIPKKRPRYYITLAPESTGEEFSDGQESVLSIQSKSTDFVKDTSDTSTSSSESFVEFEIDTGSDIAKPCPFGEESQSSPEDIPKIEIPSLTNPTGLSLNSNSDVDSSLEQEDVTETSLPNKKTFQPRICIRCGRKALVIYCDSCYKARKNFFPPRPRRRRKIIQEDVKTIDSGVFCETEDSDIKVPNVDIEPNKELCGTCMIRPKNGGYIHKNIVHVYSCYNCSVRTLYQIGRCPICNLKVKQICKIVFA